MKRATGVGISLVLLLTQFLPAASAETRTIAESSVKPIELNQIKSEQRIITLANGSAEIVAALGLKNSIVGRDIASTTPELQAIPIVTSGHQVIPEKILALKPSLVIVDKSTGPASALSTLKSSKIKIVTIPEAWNLRDISKKVSAIGEAIAQPKKAKELNQKLNSAIAVAKSKLNWRPRVAFLYLRGPSSIYLIGGPGSGADSLINSLGGIDVGAKTLKNPFNTLTAEALATVNPDVLLVMSKGLESVGGSAGLLKLPGVKQTSAGKNSKILAVDDSLLLSFGPRTAGLLNLMSAALRDMK